MRPKLGRGRGWLQVRGLHTHDDASPQEEAKGASWASHRCFTAPYAAAGQNWAWRTLHTGLGSQPAAGIAPKPETYIPAALAGELSWLECPQGRQGCGVDPQSGHVEESTNASSIAGTTN